MQLVQPFNPMQFDPTQGAGQLPVGRHPVIIEGAEVKPTNANDGGLVELKLRIIDGPHAGTTGPHRLNLYNKSVKSVEIANRQLSAICHVLQTFQLGANGVDLSVLFNKPFLVDVAPQKDEPQYTQVNKVYDMQGNEPKAGGHGQGAAAQTQNSGFQQQTPPQNNFQQQNTPPANNGNAAWGGNNQQNNQTPQQNNNQQWGNSQQQQTPPQNQGTGGWQQQNPTGNGGQVPWGQKQ